MSTTETPSRRLPCVACSYIGASAEGSVISLLSAIQHGGGDVFVDLVASLCDRHGEYLDAMVGFIENSIQKLEQKQQQTESRSDSKSN